MPQVISVETKQAIITKIREEGLSVRAASEQFHVSFLPFHGFQSDSRLQVCAVSLSLSWHFCVQPPFSSTHRHGNVRSFSKP